MDAAAHFLHFDNPADLRAGDARAVRITGIGGIGREEDETVIVFLDKDDNVSRVCQGQEETRIVSWQVRQVLLDLLDPQD